MAKAGKKGGGPDLATILGLVIGIGAVAAGLLLEGGKLSDIAQVTAGIIVLGGTIGAVMITTPLHTLIQAVKAMKFVFFESSHSAEALVEEIVRLAAKARQSSIISLEPDLDSLENPFLRKALSLAIDGSDLQEIRKTMELEMQTSDAHTESLAKVYEAAGGYAPTIGIIGAVLGLIQVMKHLENIDEVGRGIAVAFVATVYGVASANLFFLPVGNKIKARAHHELELKECLLEGVCSIVEGMNPKLIRVKLEAFVPAKSGKAKKSEAQAGDRSAQAASA